MHFCILNAINTCATPHSQKFHKCTDASSNVFLDESMHMLNIWYSSYTTQNPHKIFRKFWILVPPHSQHSNCFHLHLWIFASCKNTWLGTFPVFIHIHKSIIFHPLLQKFSFNHISDQHSCSSLAHSEAIGACLCLIYFFSVSLLFLSPITFLSIPMVSNLCVPVLCIFIPVFQITFKKYSQYLSTHVLVVAQFFQNNEFYFTPLICISLSTDNQFSTSL